MLQFFGFKKNRQQESTAQTATTAQVRKAKVPKVDNSKSNLTKIKVPPFAPLGLFIGSPDSGDIDVPNEKERLLQIIARSKFADLPPKVFDENWLMQVPAEWIIPPLEPFFDYLPINKRQADMLRELRWLLGVKCNETFERELRGYQLLKFLATEIALHHNAVLLDGASGRVYSHEDRAFILFAGGSNVTVYSASKTPSLRPFLSVTATRYGDRVWMNGHGLNKFSIPELEIETVEPELVDSTVYLLNGLAQAVIEKVIDAREHGLSEISLDEPLAIGTDMIVAGNRGDLPFGACVPRTESLRLKLVMRESGRFLNPDYDDPVELNAVLRRILQNLSLLKA